MKKADYYTWYLHLTNYNKQNPDSKFSKYLKSIDGVFKLKFLIEELYGEQVKKSNIPEYIAKADNELNLKDIEPIIEMFEQTHNNEVTILKKLEKFGEKNPNAPILIQTESTLGLLSLIKKIKDLVGDAPESEIEEVINDLNDEFEFEDADLIEEDDLICEDDYDLTDDEEMFENLDDFDDDDFYDDSDY